MDKIEREQWWGHLVQHSCSTKVILEHTAHDYVQTALEHL